MKTAVVVLASVVLFLVAAKVHGRRLRMERERLEFDRQRDREKTEEELRAWAMENRESICQGFRTNAEKIAILRKVMFADVDAMNESGVLEEALAKANGAAGEPPQSK